MSFRELEEKSKPELIPVKKAVEILQNAGRDNIMYDLSVKRLEKDDFFKTSEFKEYKKHIVESLEFDRILHFFRYARVHRPKFKGDTVEKRFNKTEKELEQFRELKRKSKGDFMNVISEYKELLNKVSNDG